MIAKYKGKTYQLKGKKVLLGNITKKHLPLFVKWLNEEEVIKHLTHISGLTLKDEIKWLERNKKLKNDITFGIYVLDGKKKIFVGSTCFKDIDLYHKKAEYGIFIGDKTHWSKGIGTETTKLMLDFGFNKLKLNSIFLLVNENNMAGQKAYKRSGFKITGKLRENRKIKGKYYDSIVMDIIKKEFKK